MMDREGWKQRALACELNNETLEARVAQLDKLQIGCVTCPSCKFEFDIDRAPFVLDKSGEGKPPGDVV